MTPGVLRFLHASDLRLEQPPQGLAEIPEHLRDFFIEAPHRAATAVFDAAIAEKVDFLLLAGGVLDLASPTPRDIHFLITQFQRLEAKGIPVYWAGGADDLPDRWPGGLPLPDNVHFFRTNRVESVFPQPENRTGPVVMGISGRAKIHAPDFAPPAGTKAAIAIALGEFEAEELEKQNIHYWAFGGRHDRHSILKPPKSGCWPGSPQGRRPSETGPHGCLLVEIDARLQPNTRFLVTDVLRYHTETLRLQNPIAPEELERRLLARTSRILAENGGRPFLIEWQITAPGPAMPQQVVDQFTRRLRQEFAERDPWAWTTRIEWQPPSEYPEAWYEEDSLLGEFLRAAKNYQTGPDAFDLRRMLPAQLPDERLAALAGPLTEAQRKQLWGRVVALGVEQLRAEEPDRPKAGKA